MVREAQLPLFGRLYVLGIVATGLSVAAGSAYSVWVQPPVWTWLIFAAFTPSSGALNIEVPEINTSFSVSEIFVFAAVLLYGIPAATLIVALDGLILQLSLVVRRPESPAARRPERFLFNVAEPALSIWLAAHLFFWIWGLDPIATTGVNPDISGLILPTAILAGSYFFFNSAFIATAIGFQRRESPLAAWTQLTQLSLNYFAGAAFALVLVRNSGEHLDPLGFVPILVLLLILHVTVKFYGRSEKRGRDLSELKLQKERDLNQLYLSIIAALANAIDAKDQITHDHIQRVQVWAYNLAKELGYTDRDTLDAIHAAALLHDTGKLGVPEYILNKPGKLTPAEFEKMKHHSVKGAEILSKVPFKYPVVPIVRHHHENWDGTGYPDGLKGMEIPPGARILAVVDCFDALTSDRPYRAKLEESEAFKILKERRGTMYDPEVVDKFMQVFSTIGPVHSDVGEARDTRVPEHLSTHPQEAAVSDGPSDTGVNSEEMLTLYDLSRALSGRAGLADAGDVIAKHLRRLLPATVCIFYSYDQSSDELVVAHVAPDVLPVLGKRIPNGHGIAGWVAANRRTIMNSDPALDLGDAIAQITPHLLSCLSTPLLIDDTLVGVLSVCSTTAAAFTDDHRRLVETVEQQISRIVRDSSVFDLRNAEYTDPLTGLPNGERLQQLTSVEGGLTCERGMQPLSVLFLRVRMRQQDRNCDRTSLDAVLGEVVATVRRVLRAGDILFRYSDDQFVIMLSQTDAETAHSIGQRIRTAVRPALASIERESSAVVSVSITSATVPGDGASLADLVYSAERRAALADEPSIEPGTSIH